MGCRWLWVREGTCGQVLQIVAGRDGPLGSEPGVGGGACQGGVESRGPVTPNPQGRTLASNPHLPSKCKGSGQLD